MPPVLLALYLFLLMQKVYESSTAPEAHTVKILLESRGIQSRIDGEHLPSGAGILPATRLVRVMVEDADFIAASEVIDNWESETKAIIKPQEKNPTHRSVLWFFIGALLASGTMYWFYNSSITVDGIDYNADGKLDAKWYYKNNRISKTTIDRNLDGRVDQIFHFSRSGLINSGEFDSDLNGSFDTKQRYLRGKIVSEETDLNQNGIVEYKVTFKHGLIESVEIIDEKTNEVRKRQYYENGRLVSADFDSTGDGVLNIKYHYDAFEEVQE